MIRNISFKFDVETDNLDEAHGLLDNLVQRMKQFHQRFPDFGIVEISLYKPDDTAHNKTGVLTLYKTDGCYQEHSSEKEWLIAIDDLFRKNIAKYRKPHSYVLNCRRCSTKTSSIIPLKMSLVQPHSNGFNAAMNVFHEFYA